MKSLTYAILLIAFAFAGCAGPDEERAANLSGYLYRDYRVLADEAAGIVTIRLQFRRGGATGAGIRLPPLAEAGFDGEQLSADSVGKIGTFYEVQKSLDAFGGLHTITFRDETGKWHKDTFVFEPVTISVVPQVVDRQGLDLTFEGAPDGTPIHLVLTDTSFLNEDINQIDTVRDGKLRVGAHQLATLRTGPVQLQLVRTSEKYFRENGRIEGQLSVSYSLQREATLGN